MHNPRLLASLGLVALTAVALSACAPDGAEQPNGEETSPVPEQSETPEETAEPTQEAVSFQMPTACVDAYTPELFDQLDGAEGFPLNDPGMTLLSTEVVGALETLDETDAMRCAWGVPSEIGVATTVAEIDEDQAEALRGAIDDDGRFECDDATPTTCSWSQELQSESGASASTQTHVFGAGGWVATNEINTGFEPAYSEAIRDTLWN